MSCRFNEILRHVVGHEGEKGGMWKRRGDMRERRGT